jgi:hypothetical protein
VRRAGTVTLPRMPFVLLVLGLLAGGLICLLVINTTLGATSFRISQLQDSGARLATQEETLQQQIAADRSPAQIARLAYGLGMRTQANTNILDLGTHRFYRLPGQAGATGAITAGNGTGTGTANGSAAKGTAAKGSAANYLVANGSAGEGSGSGKTPATTGTGKAAGSPYRSGSGR